MANKCDTGKAGFDNLNNDNEARNKISAADADKKVKATGRLLERENIVSELEKNNKPNSIIKEKDLDNAIKAVFGKDERKVLLHKIDSLFHTNEMMRPVLEDIIREHVVVHQKTGGIKDFNKLGLEALTPSSLKVVYREMNNFLAATNVGDKKGNYAVGLIKHFKVKLYTPKTSGKTVYADKDGSFFKFADEITRLHERISYRINEFMFKPKTWKSKRQYGMNDILTSLRNLADDIPLNQRKEIERPDEKIVTIWSWMMGGRVFIGPKTIKVDDKDVPNPNVGKLMIYQERASTGKKYKETDDLIFAWQDPVLLSEYKNGEFAIPFSSTMFNNLLKLVEKGRVVDNEMLDYMNERHPKSVKAIEVAMKKLFKGLTGVEITNILWKPESKEALAALNKLSDNQKVLYKKLLDAFQGYALLEPSIYNGQVAQKKENHFPVQYQKEIMPYLIDNYISRRESELFDKKGELEISTGKERKVIKKEISDLKSNISRAQFIRDRIDGYPLDTSQNIILPIAKDNKFVKRITNAFPHEAMRTDGGVYYTYSKHIMSGIQRNFLTAQLIESLATAGNEKIQDALINYYKVPFNKPDVKTNILGTYTSVENISRRLGSININITPEMLSRRIGTLNSWVTANYLSGLGTTVQNFTAINQNIIDHSWGSLRDAQDSWSKYKKEWTELINESGIVEFQDFFSKSMINDLANQELEDKTSETLLASMLQYHAEKKKIGEPKARENFESNIARALKESALFDQNIVILDESEIKQRSKERKSERNRRIINKMVQFAINKEFEFNRHIKGWKVVPYTALGAYLKTWTAIASNMGVLGSMGSTEGYIRSMSFIIGVQTAQKNGYIRDDIQPWKNKDELGAIIEIGRTFSRFTNFGLSTTDVGEGSYGRIGNLNMKFKYWSQQKFGRDVRIIKNAITSMQDIDKISKGKSANPFFNPKEVLKILKLMLSPKYMGKGSDALRKVNPEVAALRNFLFIQGIMTILFDFFIFGPLLLPGYLGRQLAIGPTKYLRGMGSDLLSLSMIVPMLALMAYMGDDEEEDVERTLTQYLRRTYIGYLPMMAWDYIVFLFYLLNDNTSGVAKQAGNITRALPGGKYAGPVVREAIEAAE